MTGWYVFDMPTIRADMLFKVSTIQVSTAADVARKQHFACENTEA